MHVCCRRPSSGGDPCHTAGMNQVGGPVICADGRTEQERQSLYRRERGGEFLRIAPGHFIETISHGDLDAEEQVLVRIAAFACCAPASVAVGRTAARLWELPILPPADHGTWRVELGRIGGRTRRTRHVHYRHLSAGHRDHIETTDCGFGTVRVTGVLATALDLARWSSLADAVRVLDHCLREDLFTHEEMERRAGEMHRLQGAAQVGQAVALATASSESPRESEVKVLLRELGAPVPWQQATIRDQRGREIGRVDFFWPELGLIIEFDGDVKYSLLDPGDNSIRLREYAQTLEYLRNGLIPIRFSSADLASGLAAATIAAHLTGGAAQGRPYPDHLWSAETPAWTGHNGGHALRP